MDDQSGKEEKNNTHTHIHRKIREKSKTSMGREEDKNYCIDNAREYTLYLYIMLETKSHTHTHTYHDNRNENKIHDTRKPQM